LNGNDEVRHSGLWRDYKLLLQRSRARDAYHGSLKVSFNHPCFEQLEQILSSLVMISEKVGLPPGSESQHSSINLHEDQDGSHKILGYSLEVLPLILSCGTTFYSICKNKIEDRIQTYSLKSGG
jgi:hypothetical protein